VDQDTRIQVFLRSKAMLKIRAAALAIGLLAGLLLNALAPQSAQAAPDAITLRVALYPYLPERYALFALLAREFQRRNPGVTLDLVEVDPGKDYYAGGLVALDADVYEIDTILLDEVIAANKIAPLAVSLAGFAPESVAAVTRNDVVYALPHWLCGNFLFYRKDDAEVRDAATWADLARVLKRRRESIFVDLFGHLTLGEWYITMLAEKSGLEAAQAAVLGSRTPDRDAVAALETILAGCPTGYCRSEAMHERPGFYARAFVHGAAAAYVGYSETIHYGLQEIIDNCQPGSGCLTADDISVRSLPSLVAGSPARGIGWVDGLAVSAVLTGAKKSAALAFLAFATSAEGYRAVLEPCGLEAPRYLLPARTGLALAGTPLYPAFYAAHAGRETGTAPGLNARLRSLAERITCELPIDRTDTRTFAACNVR
jgi:thiamine pyridinylase